MAVTRVLDAGGVANEDLVALYDFFGALRARLILIACISLGFGIVMAVVAYTIKPVYRGFAVIAPVTSDNNPLSEMSNSSLAGGLLDALTSGVSESDMATDEAMTVLTSREFTESFIRDNNLLPVLFPKLWDARIARWKEGTKRIPTLALGYIVFDKIRKIDLDSKNDFITVQIDWHDRIKAAEWANQMAERLNDEMRRRAIANSDVSLAYLQKEFAATSEVGTREAISRLMENNIRTKMLATVTQDYEIRFVDKAVVADADLPQRPNKPLLIGVGLVFGWLVGIAVALLLYRRELSSKGLL